MATDVGERFLVQVLGSLFIENNRTINELVELFILLVAHEHDLGVADDYLTDLTRLSENEVDIFDGVYDDVYDIVEEISESLKEVSSRIAGKMSVVEDTYFFEENIPNDKWKALFYWLLQMHLKDESKMLRHISHHFAKTFERKYAETPVPLKELEQVVTLHVEDLIEITFRTLDNATNNLKDIETELLSALSK